jgi:hypothetical protein
MLNFAQIQQQARPSKAEPMGVIQLRQQGPPKYLELRKAPRVAPGWAPQDFWLLEIKNGLAAFAANPLIFLLFIGRDGGIRTHDPLHPMQVRYQAALRPD